jgi:hypothetical protein
MIILYKIVQDEEVLINGNANLLSGPGFEL